jgi:hypothetical protein
MRLAVPMMHFGLHDGIGNAGPHRLTNTLQWLHADYLDGHVRIHGAKRNGPFEWPRSVSVFNILPAAGPPSF